MILKNLYWVSSFFLSVILSSCLLNQSTTKKLENNNEIKLSTKEIVEISVKDHIQAKFKDIGEYTSYRFGQLYTLKPKEIVELDQLLQVKATLPGMQEHYGNQLDSVKIATDTLIAQKKREIRQKKIYHTYEINHLFTIKKAKQPLKLYEYTFYLYPNYKIKDVTQELNTELTAEETDLFVYFIEQYPLFENENENFANQKNKRTYEMLIDALVHAGNQKEKIIHQTLSIVKHIRAHNEFNADIFCATEIKNWIMEHENYKINYRPGVFTRLKEVSIPKQDEKETETTGSIMYHKFKYQPKSSSMTEIVISFEFDLNYLPVEIIEYQKNYDQFFK